MGKLLVYIKAAFSLIRYFSNMGDTRFISLAQESSGVFTGVELTLFDALEEFTKTGRVNQTKVKWIWDEEDAFWDALVKMTEVFDIMTSLWGGGSRGSQTMWNEENVQMAINIMHNIDVLISNVNINGPSPDCFKTYVHDKYHKLVNVAYTESGDLKTENVSKELEKWGVAIQKLKPVMLKFWAYAHKTWKSDKEQYLACTICKRCGGEIYSVR